MLCSIGLIEVGSEAILSLCDVIVTMLATKKVSLCDVIEVCVTLSSLCDVIEVCVT